MQYLKHASSRFSNPIQTPAAWSAAECECNLVGDWALVHRPLLTKVLGRHGSAFRHWQTAATAAPVRHKGHARGEAEVFG